ncbi:predicted protein [Nematostella vectensis]|uniref:Uncharacterized protein n=1 Tax=Nematostella vectensis TaxID=45351 RepID=A7T108_NEMVE|nr:predicted protein [Nematostella vectensis]|eukprot:XP_001622455.1 predicted protein [Nematostella vectensis]
MAESCLHKRVEICIAASEVASAVGKHPYQRRKHTLQKVWYRSHQESFCFANALVPVCQAEVSSIVNEFIEGNAEASLELALEENWEKEKFVETLKHIILSPSSSPIRRLFNSISKALKKKLSTDERELRTIENAGVTKSTLDEAVDSLCKDESLPVQEVAKKVCSNAGTTGPDVIKAVESRLTKERGVKLEGKAVKRLGDERGKKVDLIPDEYDKTVECDGIEWRIRGRIDGMLDDKVVEVKNRKDKFMQPEYDLIQLQTYMFLFDTEEGVLLERLRGEHKETMYSFDKEGWENEVIPALKNFVVELSKYIEETRAYLYAKESGAEDIRGKRPVQDDAWARPQENQESETSGSDSEVPLKMFKTSPENDEDDDTYDNEEPNSH